jgi:hypothetical protein
MFSVFQVTQLMKGTLCQPNSKQYLIAYVVYDTNKAKY